MKRLLLLLPLLCTAVAARDPSALGMRVDTIVAGRDTVTGERLSAVRYGFTSRYAVSGFDARPEGDWAICQLSKLAPMCKYIQSFGKLIGWNMRTGEVRWAQDVRYPGGGAYQNSVRLCGDVLVQSDGLRNRCFDATSGELLPENRYGLYYLSDAGIALGYDKVRPQQLKGIDLRTGEELWTRELKFHGDRWNQVIAGDSAVLISAAGLHWVGLYSGQGWDRPLRTFRNSLSDTKHPLTSNVILSGSMLSEPVLYQASCDSMFAFDLRGNVLWATPLPDGKSGISRIYETEILRLFWSIKGWPARRTGRCLTDWHIWRFSPSKTAG